MFMTAKEREKAVFSCARVDRENIAGFDLIKDTIHNLVTRNVVPGLDEIAQAVHPKKVFPLATRDAFSEIKNKIKGCRLPITIRLGDEKLDELLKMRYCLQSQLGIYRVATTELIEEMSRRFYGPKKDLLYCAVTQALIDCGITELKSSIKMCQPTRYHWYALDEQNITLSRKYVVFLLKNRKPENSKIKDSMNPPETRNGKHSPKEGFCISSEYAGQTVFPIESNSTEDEGKQKIVSSQNARDEVPPNIVVLLKNGEPGCIQLRKKLQKKLNFDFSTTKQSEGFCKLNVQSMNDFEDALKFLKRNKIEFYCKPNKLSYPRLILRNLSATIGSKKIEAGLLEVNIQPLKVEQLKRAGYPLPIYLIVVKDDEMEKRLRKLDSLFNTDIKVESFKPERRIFQCYRCQRFGHRADHCTLKFRCVSCGDNHKSSDCQHPKSLPPYCINCCEVGHSANFRGCRKYPKVPVRTSNSVKKDVCAEVNYELAFENDPEFLDICSILRTFVNKCIEEEQEITSKVVL